MHPLKLSLPARLRNIVAKDGGFTLIEVLAVMVIVGLLAAIAIPQIGKFRERAYVSSLKSDARMLVNEAEGVYTDTKAYPADEADLVAGVDLSPHNSVVEGSYSASEAGVTFEIRNSKAGKSVTVVDNRLEGSGSPAGGAGGEESDAPFAVTATVAPSDLMPNEFTVTLTLSPADTVITSLEEGAEYMGQTGFIPASQNTWVNGVAKLDGYEMDPPGVIRYARLTSEDGDVITVVMPIPQG